VIAKIGRGSSFRGALNYVLHREHQPEIIGGNMGGTNARDLAREFGMSRQLRPEVAQPVEHVSFSWRPDERVTPDQMREAVHRWLEKMGFDLAANQHRIVQHRDRGHPHCHVIVSRIRMDDRRLVAQPWREYVRNKEVCRAIEKEMGFQRVPDLPRSRGHEWHPTRGEERMLHDRGLASEKEQIKHILHGAGPADDDRVHPARARAGRGCPAEYRPQRARERHQLSPRPGCRQRKPARTIVHLEGPAAEPRRPVRARAGCGGPGVGPTGNDRS
jgi:hypothetical protein